MDAVSLRARARRTTTALSSAWLLPIHCFKINAVKVWEVDEEPALLSPFLKPGSAFEQPCSLLETTPMVCTATQSSQSLPEQPAASHCILIWESVIVL